MIEHAIAALVVIGVLYVIYRGVTSPKRGPWDARRITAATISLLIVMLTAAVYLFGRHR